MELIYTTRAHGFEKGKHYRNPRYFDRPEQGVTSVVIEGHFPGVKAAYESAGVKADMAGDKSEKKQQASKHSTTKPSSKE